MNNIVLDVAIGLVFIYVLYSLLATTISELLAVLFSYRGRMLERGLEQMLDGRNYKLYWWDKFFGKKKKKEKYSLFASEVTGHPLYRRSSEDSLLTTRPAYIPSNVFASIILDLFRTADGAQPSLLSEISARIKARCEDQNDPLNADLARILNIYIVQANGNVERFRSLVEGWYDETMKRVSGWYKKQSFNVLLCIGFMLAVLFNVNSVGIVQKLSVDKTVREAMIKSAAEYVNANKDKFSETALADKKAAANDTTAKNIEDIKKGLKNIEDFYKNDVKQQNTTLGLGWGDFGYAADSLKWLTAYNGAKDSLKLIRDKPIRTKLVAELNRLNKKPVPAKGIWRSICHVTTYAIIENPVSLLGFMITALAVSLGAPFWFDLLNKFTNLRVSGTKPQQSNPDPQPTNKSQTPSPESFS